MDVNEVHYKNAHIQMFTLLNKKNHCRILFLPITSFIQKTVLLKVNLKEILIFFQTPLVYC